MKPKQFAYACSMKLGDNPEQARERYESLRSELIKMGYEEEFKNSWGESDQIIFIDNKAGVYGSRGSYKNSESIHGQLIETYNRSLFLAIAGQKVGGGVGCIYKHNQVEGYFAKCRSIKEKDGETFYDLRFLEMQLCGNNWDTDDMTKLFHVATIEELIEAFPNEEENGVTDEMVEASNAYYDAHKESCTIANEEAEPVKEDTKLNMGGMSETRVAEGYDGPMTGFEVFEDDEDDGPIGEPIPERADVETLIIQGGGLTFKITPHGIYCGNKDVTKLLQKVVNEQSYIQIMPF